LKLKNSKKVNSKMFTEDFDFLEYRCLDILDDKHGDIGILTGYRIHIPFLLNDMNREGYSFFEFDGNSELCSNLWELLKEKPALLHEKTGYLYFLNNINVNETHLAKEKEVMELLQKEMDIVIYSCGRTELFDDFFDKRDEAYWNQHEQMLLEQGFKHEWDLYVSKEKEIKKGLYETDSSLRVKDNPFEFWVKSKGVDWIQSMWLSVIKQNKFGVTWEILKKTMKAAQDNNEEILDANQFLKNLRINDFKQYDPEDGYLFKAPSFAKNLRYEGLLVTFKRNKFQVILSQELMDEEVITFISIGKWDQAEKGYLIEGDLFGLGVEGWMEEIFVDFFDRIHAEYKVQTQAVGNVFSMFR
jgi:hypothetical protein